MVTSAPLPGRTDAELAALDVLTLLRFGLPQDGPHRRVLFADGAVAAAIHADRYRVPGRGVGFLAEIVRAGGIRYATDLPEPLVGPEATALAQEWLHAALSVLSGAKVDEDELVGRWLDAVAAILELRVESRRRQGGGEA